MNAYLLAFGGLLLLGGRLGDLVGRKRMFLGGLALSAGRRCSRPWRPDGAATWPGTDAAPPRR
jgi:MFS family permease